jgi:hypothetical protein
VIVLLGPAQVWDNLGAYRGGAGHGLGDDAATNLRLTANILRREQAGLLVLSAAGTLLGLWRRPAITLALVAWAVAVVGLFALYGDLADKHIVYLTPPIVLLAALGIGLTSEAATSLTGRQANTRAAVVALVVGGIGLGAYLWSLPALYAADRYLLREAPGVEWNRRGGEIDDEIAEIVRARTPPDGWVLSDNPGAAFEARRKVIPYLADTSGTRIDAGSLTSPMVTDYVQRYQPSVIVTSPRRLGKLDDFVRSLPSLGYRLERSYGSDWAVYARE